MSKYLKIVKVQKTLAGAAGSTGWFDEWVTELEELGQGGRILSVSLTEDATLKKVDGVSIYITDYFDLKSSLSDPPADKCAYVETGVVLTGASPATDFTRNLAHTVGEGAPYGSALSGVPSPQLGLKLTSVGGGGASASIRVTVVAMVYN